MSDSVSSRSAARQPVTLFVSALSVAATGYWWLGHVPERLMMDGRVWSQWQLWRALTSTLLHVNALHLGFNLYWFWILGGLLERVYGHLRAVVIIGLLATAASFWDFALTSGGVGLSGVVYGQWAMLWLLGKHDQRFAQVLGPKTTQTFVVWFFLCIVMTVTKVMEVANVAHAAGAATGAVLGWIALRWSRAKWFPILALISVQIAGLAGATVLWPWVNLTGRVGLELERLALERIEQGDAAKAVQLLERATHRRGVAARTWYNLGVAYQRANRWGDAARALETAARLPDTTSDMARAAEQVRAFADVAASASATPSTKDGSAEAKP